MSERTEGAWTRNSINSGPGNLSLCNRLRKILPTSRHASEIAIQHRRVAAFVIDLLLLANQLPRTENLKQISRAALLPLLAMPQSALFRSGRFCRVVSAPTELVRLPCFESWRAGKLAFLTPEIPRLSSSGGDGNVGSVASPHRLLGFFGVKQSPISAGLHASALRSFFGTR